MSSGTINKRQRIVIVVMDLLLLAELCLAIYLGRADRAHLSGIFLRTFVPLAAVTVVGGRILIRRFGREPQAGAAPGAAS